MCFNVDEKQEIRSADRIKVVEKVVEKIVKVEVPVYRARTHPTVLQTHEALRKHPNFEFPAVDSLDVPDIVDFICEAVANYISSPKVKDEDEEFSCDDVARAIRMHLKPEIMEKLVSAFAKDLMKPKKRALDL